METANDGYAAVGPRREARTGLGLGLRLAAVLALGYLGGFLLTLAVPRGASGPGYLSSAILQTVLILFFNAGLAAAGTAYLTGAWPRVLRGWFRAAGTARAVFAGVAAGAALFAVYGVLSAWPWSAGGLSVHFKQLESYEVIARVFKHLAGPAGEEMLFRGMLFTVLARFGARRAVLLSSLVFALFHLNSGSSMDLPQALRVGWFFFAGAAYCELFRRSGSLLPAIAAHSGYNLLTSLFYLG